MSKTGEIARLFSFPLSIGETWNDGRRKTSSISGKMSAIEIFRQLTSPRKLHFFEEDTLRMNEYGLPASSGSSGHPLRDSFASCESFLMSV